MPTGFTAAVADGKITELRDFALQCARAFGALISMRDEPFDAPIPEKLTPNTTYHDERIAKARAALDEIAALSADECERREAAARAEAIKHRDEYLADKAVQRRRYEAMIAKVEAWDCKAEGVRAFMLEQLQESLKFDCVSPYVPAVPEPMSGAEWRQSALKSAADDLAYHTKGRDEEIARTADRNGWLTLLRASLPSEEREPA